MPKIRLADVDKIDLDHYLRLPKKQKIKTKAYDEDDDKDDLFISRLDVSDYVEDDVDNEN